jgi:GT2 family glycosyltransferase
MPATGIIVLNWQSPVETIACVDSLLRNLTYGDYQIFIVDNNSKDGSQTLIFNYLSTLPHKIIVVTHKKYTGYSSCKITNDSKSIVFVLSDYNGGYGYGNNLGLKLLDQNGFKYAWILNNDCIIKNDALSPMLQIAQTTQSKFVGSVIIKSSGSIECYGGGRIYPLLGRTKLLKTKYKFINAAYPYLMGASLLVDMSFIREHGYISEEYFMYFEEIDWQFRSVISRGKIDVSQSSLIFHKSGDKVRGKTYYYYKARSSIIFIQKFHGIAYIPSALLFMALTEGLQNSFRPKIFFWTLQGGFSGIYYIIQKFLKSRTMQSRSKGLTSSL